MKVYLTFLLIACPVLKLFAQDRHSLFVEFGVDRCNYSMNGLDAYLEDTLIFNPQLFKQTPDKITIGNAFNTAISYQPLNWMDVGITGHYQYANTQAFYSVIYIDPTDPENIFFGTGMTKIRVQSFMVGITTNFHLHSMLHFDHMNSSILKHIQLSTGLVGGFSNSRFLQSDRFFPHPDIGSSPINYIDYSSADFRAATELKIGYDLSHKGLVSAIGIKLGYQFINTSVLRDELDTPMDYGDNLQRQLKLDFSGFYTGVYLKMGKK